MTVDEAQEHAAKIRAGRDAGKQPLTIGAIILALDAEVRRLRALVAEGDFKDIYAEGLEMGKKLAR